MSRSFSEAKHLVQDGDIIFVHGSPNDLIQTLIMFLTGSEFSHCCIAFNVVIDGKKTVMCVEAQGRTKRRIIPLNRYCDYQLTIVAAPKAWSEVSERALHDVGLAKYNTIRAIYVGISEYLKRKYNKELPQLNRHDEICSQFCGDVYGLDVSGSPQMLYEQLMDITYTR